MHLLMILSNEVSLGFFGPGVTFGLAESSPGFGFSQGSIDAQGTPSLDQHIQLKCFMYAIFTFALITLVDFCGFSFNICRQILHEI